MAKKQAAAEETIGRAVSKTELFLENNGRNLFYVLFGVVVLGVLIYGYRSMISIPRAEKAAAMMAEAQFRFDDSNFDLILVLEGDAAGAGFLDVIDQYGSTPSGNLAKHYAGIVYLKLGDLESAAKYLAQYDPVKGIAGALINAQNFGLQGDIAVEQQDYAKAVKFFEKAAKAADNNLTAPMYLRKAGLAELAQGNTKRAIEFFERILASYPASMDAREAEKLIGSVK